MQRYGFDPHWVQNWWVSRTRAELGAENTVKILEEAKIVSEIALLETKEKIKVLKNNDVVDAGALRFVKILEAWLEDLKGIKFLTTPAFERVEKEIRGPLKYRYCLQFSFKKGREGLDKLKEKIKLYGNSIEVLEIENRIKIHLHTNLPEKLKKEFGSFPEFQFQIDDMEKTKELTK